MNKKTIRLRCLITALLLVVAMAMPAAASAAITPVEPTTGDGTSENPYQITTAAELSWFADKVNNDNANYSSKNAVLIADIDLEGSATNTWTPIGNTTNQFKGTFDGGGHKITGLYISKSGNSKGLFGYLGSGGVIKNLGVDGSVLITGNIAGNNIGGVCGYNEGTITGCYNNGAVTGNGATGGVCGYNEGTMENCYNKGTVNGYDEVGGVCGHSEGTITNCYNTGTVTGTYRFTGGVCGRTGAKTTITGCYNTGAVTGTNDYIASTVIEGEDYSARGVGGICGYNCGGTISNNYNIGSVTGKKIVGGVCGYNTNYTTLSVLNRSKGTLKNCYNTGTISDEEPAGVTEQINDGGVCGLNDNSNSDAITNCYYLSVSGIIISNLNDLGTAISAEELAVSGTFSEWDFSATWEIIDFWGRPTLRSNSEIEGKGTESEPYQIPNLAILETLRNVVNAGRDYSGVYFALMADIDMSGTYGNDFFKSSWTPIGSVVNQFKGSFDGGGHKITGLYTRGSTGFRGLFGYLGSGGVIKNLGVEGTVTDTGSDYGSVGGVCGYSAGTITGCYNKATVSGYYESVGGVCGKNGGTITNCYNTGDVSGTGSNTGGVCGMNNNTITGCYNTGTISGIDRVGGVCGYNGGKTLTGCYNTGTVSGTSEVGGVCGLNNSKTITDCYNKGIVSGTGSNIGGVCGKNDCGTITSCYNISEVSGAGAVGGVCGFNNSGIVLGAISGSITNCYNTGTVSGTGSNIGGVCGQNDGGTITNCYNINEVSGDNKVGGVCGSNNIGTNSGTGSGTITGCYYLDGCNGEGTTFNDLGTAISAAEFVVETTFVNWDFTNIWESSWLGRPILSSNPETNWRGTGTETNPLPIPDLATLESLRDEVNAGRDFSGVYFTVTADIDMSGKYNSATGKSWTPIGNETNQFKGGFDGAGHKISGLYISSSSSEVDQGLFGYLGKGGVIENLGVDSNIYNSNKTTGGICGCNAGIISYCYTTGTVNGFNFVGGVCGWNGDTGLISYCYNAGVVNGSGGDIGGVCGTNTGRIFYCYNIGVVTGTKNVGSVCGHNSSTIAFCYYDSDKCKVGGIGGSGNSYNTGEV
ncbi:MAG: GLUG motif-containing protein, partial [Muribaculaceae bacterium]